jgi:hypothetical protein
MLHFQELEDGGTIVCDCNVSDIIHKHLREEKGTVSNRKSACWGLCLHPPCPALQAPSWCELCWQQH